MALCHSLFAVALCHSFIEVATIFLDVLIRLVRAGTVLIVNSNTFEQELLIVKSTLKGVHFKPIHTTPPRTVPRLSTESLALITNGPSSNNLRISGVDDICVVVCGRIHSIKHMR